MTVNRESLNVRLGRLQSLPPLPAVVPQVIRLVEKPDTSATDLEEVIRTDPALCVKILRTVNSPYYRSTGKEITSIRRAIARLSGDAPA